MRSLLVIVGCVGMVLGAQDLEPAGLGVQGRLSLPEGGFRDALGNPKAPGIGVGLFAQVDLEGPWRGRVALGTDRWIKGDGLPGQDREIQAFHASVEVVYTLRDEGPHPVLGPYLVTGLGGYAWSLGADVTTSGRKRRVVHAAATGGFGWRWTPRLDLEVRFLAGSLEPGLTASAVVGAINLRF